MTDRDHQSPEDRDAENLSRLYRAYQATREPAPSRDVILAFARHALRQRAAGESVTRPEVEPTPEETVDSPDHLYRLYQQQRDVPASATLGPVLEKARAKLATMDARKADRPDPGRDRPGIGSAIFNAPARALSALLRLLQGSADRRAWQVLVPIAATALLLVAVIPAIKLFEPSTGLDKAQIAQIFPLKATRDLLDDASRAIAFVETGTDEGMGFSQSTSRASTAFRYGVLTVSSAIAVQAQDRNRSVQLARRLIRVSEQEQNAELTRNLGAALTEQADLRSLGLELQKVSNNLGARFGGENRYRPYYMLGQWVETAHIAAQHALATTDNRLLVDALRELQPLQLAMAGAPDLDPAVTKQLLALSGIDPRPDMSRESVRAAAESLQRLKYLLL